MKTTVDEVAYTSWSNSKLIFMKIYLIKTQQENNVTHDSHWSQHGDFNT